MDGHPALSLSFTFVQLCYNFQCIYLYNFAMLQNCFRIYISLKVFNGFLILIPLPTTKNGLHHVILSLCKQRVAQPFYCVQCKTKLYDDVKTLQKQRQRCHLLICIHKEQYCQQCKKIQSSNFFMWFTQNFEIIN